MQIAGWILLLTEYIKNIPNQNIPCKKATRITLVVIKTSTFRVDYLFIIFILKSAKLDKLFFVPARLMGGWEWSTRNACECFMIRMLCCALVINNHKPHGLVARAIALCVFSHHSFWLNPRNEPLEKGCAGQDEQRGGGMRTILLKYWTLCVWIEENVYEYLAMHIRFGRAVIDKYRIEYSHLAWLCGFAECIWVKQSPRSRGCCV